jgi:hypothetical protein
MYVSLGLRQVSVKRDINKILSVFDYSHARKMPGTKDQDKSDNKHVTP